MIFLKLTTNRSLSKNKVSINGDEITIEVIDATNDKQDGLGITQTKDTFSLSELITNFSQDHGCIALIARKMNTSDESPMLALETTQLSLPHKVTSGSSFESEPTTPGKNLSGSPYAMVSERYGSYAYVYILTPTVNCAIEDLIIIYRDSGSAEITVNDSPINFAVPIESTKLFLDTWMPIAVDGPDTISVDGINTYTVTSTPNAIVYISSDIGIINRSRVVSGKTFTLNASGLEVGETITIKTGYKFWHGVTDKVITVV
jgi:hypothetical protein